MFLVYTLTLLALPLSRAMLCTDVVCEYGGDPQPQFLHCDDDEFVDAVCNYLGFGWVVARSSEGCVLSDTLVDVLKLHEECTQVSVEREVLEVQNKLDALDDIQDKLDIILHDMALRGPLVEDCDKDDQWCVHIVENGSTSLDEKFKGSTILRDFVHDDVKDWLYAEFAAAGMFDDDYRDPYACYIGRDMVNIADDFHRNCDDVGSFTVTLVQSDGGSVFGIVATLPFSPSSDRVKDTGAFVFSLHSERTGQPTGFRINPSGGGAEQWYYTTNGPRWADGFTISDSCMATQGQGKGGAFGTGWYWEKPSTEWEKSHMYGSNPYYDFTDSWFMCQNLEVWIVSASSSSSS